MPEMGSNFENIGEPSKLRGTKRSANSVDSSSRKMQRIEKKYFHSINQAEKLWNLRDTGRLCDVKIQVGPTQQVLVCHKNVLLVSSQYFEKIFTYEDEGFVHQTKDGVHESMEEIVTPIGDPHTTIITVDKEGREQINEEVVNAVLRFIYVGILPDGIDSIVPPMFALADMWLLEELKKICIDKMIKDISASNFQQLLRFADKYHISQLSKAIQDFVPRYLPHIYQNEEFVKLKEEDIENMLSKPLTYEHENLVFLKALNYWCIHSEKKWDSVLNMVKLDLLTKVQLQNFSNSSEIQEEKDFKDKVIAALTNGNDPPSARYFPLMEDNRLLELNSRKDWGTIVDFRPKMIVTNPLKVDHNIIIDFIRKFMKPSFDGGHIYLHSEVCYKNTIYALFKITKIHRMGQVSEPDQPEKNILIFTYSLLQGTTKPLVFDFTKIYPGWNEKMSKENGLLHLKDNKLFYSAHIVDRAIASSYKRHFIILYVDLDKELSEWEIILNWKYSKVWDGTPRLIQVVQDGIFVNTTNAHDVMKIIKLPRYDSLSPENNEDNEMEITNFPLNTRTTPCMGKNSMNDIFYDSKQNRLFVLYQALIYIYDFKEDLWTNLPHFNGIQKLRCIHLEDNKLYVMGTKTNDGCDECEVFDFDKSTWQTLEIGGPEPTALPLQERIGDIQSRGFPVSRLLLCKDESVDESDDY